GRVVRRIRQSQNVRISANREPICLAELWILEFLAKLVYEVGASISIVVKGEPETLDGLLRLAFELLLVRLLEHFVLTGRSMKTTLGYVVRIARCGGHLQMILKLGPRGGVAYSITIRSLLGSLPLLISAKYSSNRLLSSDRVAGEPPARRAAFSQS